MKGKHAHPSHNYLYVLLLILSCVLVVSGYLVYTLLDDRIPNANEVGSSTAVTTTTTPPPTTTTTPQGVKIPHIGDNGNWFIGETDTGIKATGTDGKDGITPHIGDNGNWWIGETDTGVKAAGTDGKDGITPHIGNNGNWWLGETDTGLKASGTDGKDGITPHIGDNGNWWIGETDTGVKAVLIIPMTTTTPSSTVTATVTTSTTKATTSTATKDPAATTTTVPPKTSVSFPKTLFIGDSRTHGLSLYGKITDADFFAYTSFSSFNILKKELKFDGLGTVTLEQLLTKRTYKTVYLMLGINEIGSNIDTIVNRYNTIIDLVKEKQPNAIIIVQGTLHVREDKQTSSISNERINTLNGRLAALADNTTLFYLDVNPVFDNENGAMDKKYSGDGVHFYSKYYLLWRDYLTNNRP